VSPPPFTMEALSQAQDHGRDDTTPTLPFSLNSNATSLQRSFHQHFPYFLGKHPHAPEGAVILGGTIARRVPLAMLEPASPFSAQLRAFLSYKPPPSSSGETSLPSWRLSPTSLPSSAPAAPAENSTTVFERISRLTPEELAPLADSLPADLRSSVLQLLRFRLTSLAAVPSAAEEDSPAGDIVTGDACTTTAVTSPPAAVPSRDATGRLRPPHPVPGPTPNPRPT